MAVTAHQKQKASVDDENKLTTHVVKACYCPLWSVYDGMQASGKLAASLLTIFNFQDGIPIARTDKIRKFIFIDSCEW